MKCFNDQKILHNSELEDYELDYLDHYVAHSIYYMRAYTCSLISF